MISSGIQTPVPTKRRCQLFWHPWVLSENENREVATFAGTWSSLKFSRTLASVATGSPTTPGTIAKDHTK